MNKFIQNLLLILLPFYPFWAWLAYTLTNKPIGLFVSLIMLPIAMYLVIYVNKKLPKYLILLIIFTFYHIGSIYTNNTFPDGINKLFFLLTDSNILACLFFIIIEYSIFNHKFISKMNKLILIVVVISLVVSIIQIKLPTFFFLEDEQSLIYVEGNRCFSIYSWNNLNSIGISFPILISILVSVFERKKTTFLITIICGVVVSFLSRARYVMISGFVAFSQIFFNTKTSLKKKVTLIGAFVAILFLIYTVASNSGYDISEVVNTRILEKDTDMASAKARILSYEVFLMVFPKNPWFGIGPKTKEDVIELLDGVAPIIHVGYLSYLYYYGIFGCSIFFFAIYYLLKDAWLVGKRNNFWGSFYGLMAFCLANLTFVFFDLSEMGIVIALIYLRYFKYNNYLFSMKSARHTVYENHDNKLQTKTY